MAERGYTLIEPEIHEKLAWNLDLIVKCLEIIRLELGSILDINSSGIEYDLIAVGNPFGGPYPGIGIHCVSEAESTKIPEWDEIGRRVELWIENLGLDNLVKAGEKIDYIDWETLLQFGTYPKRIN
ncbi:hypothetical protein GO730_05750 [Spirosoma sp. HMF3257]|uniref:Uncharacterized protein n=1 Tax=Spirosoma telluris TaxID=2183553 RepID=A0A327NFA0_9BACT|nr:hypothetical protein [Spirosoma telluris]RAI73981.1 hypothetical protein HMF3257_05715 [Spirosoma telluris]